MSNLRDACNAMGGPAGRMFLIDKDGNIRRVTLKEYAAMSNYDGYAVRVTLEEAEKLAAQRKAGR